RRGALIDVSPPGSESRIVGLYEDRRGRIWALTGTITRALMRYADGQWTNIDQSWGVTDAGSLRVAEDADGVTWILDGERVTTLTGDERVLRDTGLRIPLGSKPEIANDRQGRVWITDRKTGTRRLPRLVPGQAPAYSPAIAPVSDTHRNRIFLFDRDGAIWGVTFFAGIFRVADPQSLDAGAMPVEEAFAVEHGLSGNRTVAIAEDREGNIWVGTSAGLDRFRAANVRVEPRISTGPGRGLYAGSNGAIYVIDADSVHRALPARRIERLAGGFNSPQALCEANDGSLWVKTDDAVLHGVEGRFETIPVPFAARGVLDCVVAGDGSLWFTRFRGGASRLRDGQTIPELGADQPGAPVIRTMIRASDGSLIAYLRARGVYVLTHGEPRPIWPYAEIPGRDVIAMHAVGDTVLMATMSTLARYAGGRVATLRRDDPWLEGIGGIVESDGQVWLFSRVGIARIAWADLDRGFDDPSHALVPEIFTYADGVPSPVSTNYSHNRAARGGDGKLWFVTTEHIATIDPARLHRNALPPPVAITALAHDGATLRDPATATLPAGTSRIEIDYTAPSLSIPERVRFRYRLDGADADWVDPGARREAFYTNLPPGDYRFRVIAANDDGVWNRDGATLAFTLPPTFVQSVGFRLLLALAAIVLGAFAWRLRLRQVTARLQSRFDARIGERERIARELHDTLLQGVQGLMLRFQAAANRVTAPEVRASLDDALERADAVLIEGRARVRDLRGTSENGELGQRLRDLAATIVDGETPRVDLATDGTPRALHPLVPEEALRIAEEAMRNAVRHAQAGNIHLSIVWRHHEFALCIRDNGGGIAPATLAAGSRTGHYGLVGMRERARQIGGELRIRSSEATGTEVALVVPARAAYADRGVRFFATMRRWFGARSS
ncbi:MAG TPA: triple tyrosine motif-containing protein, partial [Tahibacter sp.]|nr:triple tyrosine motif-containing protein [Tahibacter sp.]